MSKKLLPILLILGLSITASSESHARSRHKHKRKPQRRHAAIPAIPANETFEQKVLRLVGEISPGCISDEYPDQAVRYTIARVLEGNQLMRIPFQKIQGLNFVNLSKNNRSPRAEIFGTARTYEFLEALAQFTREKLGLSWLHVTALTTGPQLYNDRHCFHRAGNAIDLHPLPGDGPTNVYDRNPGRYQPEMVKQFLLQVLADTRVKRVFFNDKRLLNDSDIFAVMKKRYDSGDPVEFRSAKRHENHLHIELKLEEAMEAKIDSIEEQLFGPIPPEFKIRHAAIPASFGLKTAPEVTDSVDEPSEDDETENLEGSPQQAP